MTRRWLLLAVLTGCTGARQAPHAPDAAPATDAADQGRADPGFDASLDPDAPPAGATAPERDRPPDIVVPTLETDDT